MSTWKKADKVNQKTHRERQQLHNRSHLGFLEKKQDYKRRANHENERKHVIKTLKKKALNKNPDEFYFHMVNSKVVKGVHRDIRKEMKHTPEQLALMQTRDLKYINARRTMEKKKIDKLKSELHFIAEKLGQKRTNRYMELDKRIRRERELGIVQRKLEIKKFLTEKGATKAKKIKAATTTSAPVYKWKQERKK